MKLSQKNMKNICAGIRKNPNTKIKILVGKIDDLCLQCPYKYKNRCIQSKKIGKWGVAQDKKVANFLKIKPNSIHAAKDIFNLAMDKINDNSIEYMCKGCIFLDNCRKVGINSSFRRELNKT